MCLYKNIFKITEAMPILHPSYGATTGAKTQKISPLATVIKLQSAESQLHFDEAKTLCRFRNHI